MHKSQIKAFKLAQSIFDPLISKLIDVYTSLHMDYTYAESCYDIIFLCNLNEYHVTMMSHNCFSSL